MPHAFGLRLLVAWRKLHYSSSSIENKLTILLIQLHYSNDFIQSVFTHQIACLLKNEKGPNINLKSSVRTTTQPQ